MNADSLANRSLVHAKRTLPLRSLAVITALCLSGCGTSDKTADGPSLADLDAKSVDAVVDTGTPSDASADTNKDAVSLSCTSDLECLADLKESTCAKPRCVKGQCVQQALTKGTPCKPDGLEVAACQQTTCDGTGKCLFSPAADGKPCGEGKCGDACVAGKCVMGANKDDGDPCTETVCIGGIVSHQPITDPTFVCKDGGKCIDEGACIQGKCTGAKVLCDDGVACTIDFCQPGQGCMFLPANGLCDDGNPCTQSACNANKGCTSGPGKAGVP
ncbi:MAG: hypothetical protein KC502_14045, partial [Myxococcales bacterium]|nr:hypothetical protein [Myxococcales bacterium]